MSIAHLSSALFMLPPASSRLQQLLYNQAILTSVREVVDIEVFDKSTVLTEIFTVGDMEPIHVFYFGVLIWFLYQQRELYIGSLSLEDKERLEREKQLKPIQLLKDGYSIRRTIRTVLFIFLFIFTKNVEHVS